MLQMTYKERLRVKKTVHKTTFGWEIIHHLQNQQGGSTMDDDELLNLQKRASNATCPTSPSNVEHRSHAQDAQQQQSS